MANILRQKKINEKFSQIKIHSLLYKYLKIQCFLGFIVSHIKTELCRIKASQLNKKKDRRK